MSAVAEYFPTRDLETMSAARNYIEWTLERIVLPHIGRRPGGAESIRGAGAGWPLRSVRSRLSGPAGRNRRTVGTCSAVHQAHGRSFVPGRGVPRTDIALLQLRGFLWLVHPVLLAA